MTNQPNPGPGVDAASSDTSSVATIPTDDSYMPNYLFLIAGFLTPGMLPGYGYLLPGSYWVPYSELLDVFDPLGIAKKKNIPKTLRDFYYAWSPTLTGLMGVGFGISIGAFLVRLRMMTETIARDYHAEEARARRLMNESIDRLTLANEAMFSFMAKEWGITEEDVTQRVEEIFSAEVGKFLEAAAARAEAEANAADAF